MFESAIKPVWWLPSFGFCLFLAIEFWMVFNPDRIFQDPGVGRHLRTAEVILETGHIPRADPLSFTKAGEPWTDFEWAFEATLGELYRLGGLGLVCAFCYSIFAATVLGIYRTLLQSGLSLTAVLLTTSMAFLTLQIHSSARPVLFTYLFMALVVEVWRRRTQPLLRDWLILPLIFVAWANLHAGWLAALVFLALAIIGRVLDRITDRASGDDVRVLPWIGLTLLCFAATFVNPWGWKLHLSVFHLATSLKSAALWDEYLPPNFGVPTMSAITVLFVVATVFLARLSTRAPLWRWEIIVPILFFLYEGLKAQRHVLLLMEVAALPVARDLEVILFPSFWHQLWEQLKQFQARQRQAGSDSWQALAAELLLLVRERLEAFRMQQRLAGGDAWLALVAAVAMAWLFVHTPRARDIQVGGNITPKLLSFMRDHPDRFHRPLTTTWNAGPLLWNLRPDFRVSLDDRGDFYGDDVVFSNVDLTKGAAGWEEKLAKGNYDSLILDPYLEINQLLRFVPEWKQVYRDEHVVIYWRDN